MSTINSTDVFLIGRGSANYKVTAGDIATFAGPNGGDIPFGNITFFAQAAAPTGWTQVTDAAFNDAAIKLMTTTGGASGGTINFSTFFNPSFSYTSSLTFTSGSVGNTTISLAQMNGHAHAIPPGGGSYQGSGSNSIALDNGSTPTGSSGSDQAHTHSLVGAVANGTANANFAVKYVSLIACQ